MFNSASYDTKYVLKRMSWFPVPPPVQSTWRASPHPVKRNPLKMSSSASRCHIMKLTWENGFLNERPKLHKLETAWVPQRGQSQALAQLMPLSRLQGPWEPSYCGNRSAKHCHWWQGYPQNRLSLHLKSPYSTFFLLKPESQVITRTIFFFMGGGSFLIFDPGSHTLAQLWHIIHILSQPPGCWDYRMIHPV